MLFSSDNVREIYRIKSSNKRRNPKSKISDISESVVEEKNDDDYQEVNNSRNYGCNENDNNTDKDKSQNDDFDFLYNNCKFDKKSYSTSKNNDNNENNDNENNDIHKIIKIEENDDEKDDIENISKKDLEKK